MNIRKTRLEDLDAVMCAYGYARQFMQAHGNEKQWADGYPGRDLIAEDIRKGGSYVCEDEAGEIVGVFYCAEGEDPTYRTIYEGEWLNDGPYATIHRIATNGRQKGVAAACIQWAFARYENVRIDTHRDNTVMHNLLQKHGFTRCGIIQLLRTNDERVAYQWTKQTAR